MSDLSIDSDHDEPWEIKSAGENRGYGLFAARDVKAGEVVLSDWTSILINDNRNNTIIDGLIERYEDLDDREKKAWRRLAMYEAPGRAERLTRRLDDYIGPEGTKLDAKEKALYLRLWLIYRTNCFETKPGMNGVFLGASRFNHSCDPNIWYETNVKYGRWIGRANRNIKKGEEFKLSYLPHHADRAERNENTRSNWGFDCDCQRCAGGADEYTAQLAEACDIANGVDPDRTTMPPTHEDRPEARCRQLMRRVELLREIVKKLGKEDKDKSRTKELVYALWDLASYHQHCYLSRSDIKPSPAEWDELERNHAFASEALDVARTVWPEGHQMVRACQKEVNWARVKKFMDKKFMDNPAEDPDDIPDSSDESDDSQDADEA